MVECKYFFNKFVENDSMIREKEIKAVLQAFKKLTKDEQYEVRRKLLLAETKKRVEQNWSKYPDANISEDEIMEEVKTVRNASKKKN